MGQKTALILGVLAVIIGILAYSALFTVHQTQHAIVLQFGAIKQVYSEPGLKVKMPFIQDVRYVERRVLNLDPPVLTIQLIDQRRLQVDSFVRYRITDPETFIRTAISEEQFGSRLETIVNNSVRAVMGGVSLVSVLSEDRRAMMERIRADVNDRAGSFGINVVDVRIGRADLSAEVSESVYRRMRAERERDAAEFRAEGQELYQRITSAADREKTVIIAEATREAETLRGEGEGQRTQILNEAYGQDPDFFRFYRTMQAYEGSLQGENNYMVLSTDNEFFEFFGDGIEQQGSGGAQ
jgi:membrane protease subunit HflC